MATLIMSKDSIINTDETIDTFVESFLPYKVAERKADIFNAALTEDDVDSHVQYSVLENDYTENEFYS